MKVDMSPIGVLKIKAETELEVFALKQWCILSELEGGTIDGARVLVDCTFSDLGTKE